MAARDDRTKVLRAYTAVQAVRSYAVALQGVSGSIKFNNLRDLLDQMRDAWDRDGEPLLAYGEADVNAAVPRHLLSAPANAWTLLQNLRTALIAFYTAYKPIHDGAGNTQTFTLANGHQYINVPVSALAPLAASLAAVVAACDPLALDA